LKLLLKRKQPRAESYCLKPQEGKVVAVGSGTLKDGERIALEVKEGDRIIFSKYAGTEVKFEERELLILRESDILAIIE
jgi:chaperonin GroES